MPLYAILLTYKGLLPYMVVCIEFTFFLMSEVASHGNLLPLRRGDNSDVGQALGWS